jgi:hypothetical protein
VTDTVENEVAHVCCLYGFQMRSPKRLIVDVASASLTRPNKTRLRLPHGQPSILQKKTYSTEVAAKRIGVSFRTLNRWLALGKIKPSLGIPFSDGRKLRRWPTPTWRGGARSKPHKSRARKRGGNESRYLSGRLRQSRVRQKQLILVP